MVKRRKANKPNATGRNPTSRFVRLDFRLLQSNAYRSLTPNARALLTELAMLYNGSNNGSLYLGVQDATHRIGCSDHHVASRAFDELQALGFIEMTNDAHFAVKASETSRARTWRLTWEPGPGRKMASWTFLEREPDLDTPERKRMERGLRALKAHRKDRDRGKFPVVESTTMPPNPAVSSPPPVVNSTTLIDPNGGSPPNGRMVDEHHHIATTMGSAAERASISWWAPRCSRATAQWAFAALVAHSLASNPAIARQVA